MIFLNITWPAHSRVKNVSGNTIFGWTMIGWDLFLAVACTRSWDIAKYQIRHINIIMIQTPWGGTDDRPTSNLPGPMNTGVELVTRVPTGPAAKLFEFQECDRQNLNLWYINFTMTQVSQTWNDDSIVLLGSSYLGVGHVSRVVAVTGAELLSVTDTTDRTEWHTHTHTQTHTRNENNMGSDLE